MWEDLAQSSVNLAKHLPSHHRHFVNDEVLHIFQKLLKALSLQIFELPLDRQAQQGVECKAMHIECSCTSRSCDIQSVSQEKFQAIDQVRLPGSCCARDKRGSLLPLILWASLHAAGAAEQ